MFRSGSKELSRRQARGPTFVGAPDADCLLVFLFFIPKNTGHDTLSPCNYSEVVLNHSSHVPHKYLGRCMHQRLCV